MYAYKRSPMRRFKWRPLSNGLWLDHQIKSQKHVLNEKIYRENIEKIVIFPMN